MAKKWDNSNAKSKVTASDTALWVVKAIGQQCGGKMEDIL